jgi:hypothetical protein
LIQVKQNKFGLEEEDRQIWQQIEEKNRVRTTEEDP